MARFSATTLAALQTLLNRVEGIDSCRLNKIPSTGLTGTPAPCRAGISVQEFLTLDPAAPVTGLRPLPIRFHLDATWFLGVVSITDTPHGNKPGPSGIPPRRWAHKTLEAITTLLDPSDGFYAFALMDAATHTPKGTAQDCDRGIVATEWVDQICGYAGDDFSGTVTWKLGDYYLVGSFHC